MYKQINALFRLHRSSQTQGIGARGLRQQHNLQMARPKIHRQSSSLKHKRRRLKLQLGHHSAKSQLLSSKHQALLPKKR